MSLAMTIMLPPRSWCIKTVLGVAYLWLYTIRGTDLVISGEQIDYSTVPY